MSHQGNDFYDSDEEEYRIGWFLGGLLTCSLALLFCLCAYELWFHGVQKLPSSCSANYQECFEERSGRPWTETRSKKSELD